ncbi:MAG: hypothetical protein FJ151_00025 [Euryarchaeota archaeon]|nr:hypothetical protein [Euryarchaeota archaeon]
MERGDALDAGTRVMPGGFFSEGRYAIERDGCLYQISPGKILCQGNARDDTFESHVLKPVLLRTLAPKGWGMMHAAAASIGRSIVVFPGASGTGKTSLLLELLLRGADFVAGNNVLVGKCGEIVAYPRPIILEERHFRLYPELLELAFATGAERREQRRRLSRLEIGRSIGGSNPLSRMIRHYCNLAYFRLSRRCQDLFPDAPIITGGKASDVFLLIRKKGSPKIVRSESERVALLSSPPSSPSTLHVHANLSHLAGLHFPSREQMVAVFRGFADDVRCHEIHVGENVTRRELSEIADGIEARMS